MAFEELIPSKKRFVADFCRMLVNLLPLGRLWDPVGESLKKLLEGFSEEFNRNDQRNLDLITQLIPAQSTELLEDWERVSLAPDELLVGGGTVAERQLRVSTKLFNTQESPTQQFFEDLAAARGITIAISFLGTRYRVGVSRVGERLAGPSVAFSWIVDWVAGDKTEYTRLEPTFRRLKHAHTNLIFNPPPP